VTAGSGGVRNRRFDIAHIIEQFCYQASFTGTGRGGDNKENTCGHMRFGSVA
jgi:hypothetical protein